MLPSRVAKVSLPIDKYEDEIVRSISSNDVIIIESCTGSGKTVRVPQFILDSDSSAKIAVTQPRRIATRTVSERVAFERDSTVGSHEVGYKMSMDQQVSPSTAITYMTTGTLLQIIINQSYKMPYTHLILDEVHIRDLQTDLLLLVLKHFQLTRPFWNVKIILLSATIDASAFLNYFDYRDRVKHVVIGSHEKLFKIHDKYIEDIEALGVFGIQNPDPNELKFSLSNYHALPLLLESLADLDENGVKGSVLVFLPGAGEIGGIHDLLESRNVKTGNGWMIGELHSNVPLDQQISLFGSCVSDKRCIILATNIAESSITLPNIRYVVDSCLKKRMIHDEETNSSFLDLQLVSRHECVQRAGRTGRTGSGFVFRLVTREFYENSIEEQSAPEMTTCGLGLVFLWLKKLKMGSPHEFLKLAMNPPSEFKLESCVESLKECGALHVRMWDGKYSRIDGNVSSIGHLSTLLSLDPRLARLVSFGHVFGLLKESVVLAAALCNHPIFIVPSSKQGKLAAWRSKMEFSKGHLSDGMAIIQAYRFYLNLKGNPDKKEILKRVFLNVSNLRDVEFTVDRIMGKLSVKYGVRIGTHFINIEAIHYWKFEAEMLIAAACYPNLYYKSKIKNQKLFMTKVNDEVLSRDPLRCVTIHPPLCAGTPTPGNMKNIASMLQSVLETIEEPFVVWNKDSDQIVAEFQKCENNLGRAAFPVYTAMKMKCLDFHFSYQDESNSQIICGGPNSPLKMNFMNFANAQYQRMVYQDQNSLCVVNVDENYDQPTSYVLAALRISKSKSTQCIVTRDAARLEAIPGLFGILNIIYAPKVSLRRKQKIPGFTSAVCGLGLDPVTNKPIAASRNNDCLFDMNMNQQDIVTINKLRSYIDELLQYKSFMKESEEIEITRQALLCDMHELVFAPREANADKTCFPLCHWDQEQEYADTPVGSLLFPPHQF